MAIKKVRNLGGVQLGDRSLAAQHVNLNQFNMLNAEITETEKQDNR